MKKIIYLLTIVMLVSGCTWGKAVTMYTSFTDTKYPPKSENDEILLLTSTKPDRPYVEIGIIKVMKSAMVDSSKEREMIKKAREIGADAVIDIKQVAYGTEHGTAIVFTDK